MNVSDIRELTDGEITARIAEERDHLLRLNMNNAVSGVESPAKIRATKRTIARLLTVIKERELASNTENNNG